MAESILKIHTQNGDIPVGYPGLANKPIADKTLSVEGAFADSKAVGDKFKQVKEDISTKIAKFYASSQGETHLADSDNGKIMDMMVYGKSEQKQYSGKNLFTFSNNSRDINSVIFEAKDGIITAKGTSTKEFTSTYFQFNYPKDIFTIGETYTFSLNSNDANLCLIALYKENDMVDYRRLFEATTKCATVKIPDNVDLIIRCVVDINATVNATATIQIEKGSTATSYEPYVGGYPSPSPDYPQEIKSVVNPKVVVYGKNIAKKVAVFNESQQYAIPLYIVADLRPSTTYVLSFECASGYSGYVNEIIFEQITFVGTGNRQSVVCKTKSVLQSSQLTAKGWIIVKNFTGNTIVPKFTNVMLERISASIAYEPYHEQTVTLPYALNAIPVSSGGNVTIDGQQYIADYVDVERGKLVRMCKEVNALDYEWTDRYERYVSIDYGILPECRHSGNVAFAKSTHDYYTSFQDKWTDKNTVIFLESDQSIGLRIAYNLYVQSNYSNLAEFKEWLKSQADNGTPLKIVYALATPEEIDLTTEEISAFKALATYYPTTNISVNSEQLDGYTVFNYPISMENGWNYVKQQIGDTRDYIYDMDARAQDTDLQAAEAYVNSEYAVALTELEV